MNYGSLATGAGLCFSVALGYRRLGGTFELRATGSIASVHGFGQHEDIRIVCPATSISVSEVAAASSG